MKGKTNRIVRVVQTVVITPVIALVGFALWKHPDFIPGDGPVTVSGQALRAPTIPIAVVPAVLDTVQPVQAAVPSSHALPNPDVAVAPVDEPKSEDAASISDSDIIAWIDEFAGHPDDPSLPSTALGASDEVLRQRYSVEVADFIQATRAFAESHPEQPRLMFAVGRAAAMHGYDRLAESLLSRASEHGSGPAFAYLAFLHSRDQQDYSADALEKLHRAASLGFKSAAVLEATRPAAVPPVEITGIPDRSLPTDGASLSDSDQSGRRRFDPKDFNRPDLMAALHRHDSDALLRDKLGTFIYLAGVQESIADLGTLFLIEDRRYVTEVDGGLGSRIAQFVASDRDAVRDGGQGGLASMFGPLMAAMEARQRGGSIQEEVHAMTSAAAKTDLSPQTRSSPCDSLGADQGGQRRWAGSGIRRKRW